MKINHDLIRKFIRVFGISLFGIVCFLKFKKLIESGGKEIDPKGEAIEHNTKSQENPNVPDNYDDN